PISSSCSNPPAHRSPSRYWPASRRRGRSVAVQRGRANGSWAVMGAASSRLEKALGEQFPEGERYFGLENFGNTCYCNSVLQVRPPQTRDRRVRAGGRAIDSSCSMRSPRREGRGFPSDRGALNSILRRRGRFVCGVVSGGRGASEVQSPVS
uniref:Uncharacterized protein n=1 Tax=Aegilops tauschii subsp. strangulata TaxID=200361 RepID=A0A453QTM0_AEGTS